jgi:uracil-DNA glycosylase
MADVLERLVAEIRACRHCVEQPKGRPLPHEPRPVVRVSATARLAICSQAPGVRVHASGVPFSDPSGVRLRDWMGVTAEEFYDVRRVAFVPMGFCFPGHDSHGGDLPPRRECARLWRGRLFDQLPRLELMLLVGQYAQRWHLGERCGRSVGDTVRRWRIIFEASMRPRFLPLPHPSWRNNAWLTTNAWFATELLPVLRAEVRRIMSPAG